MNWTSVLGWISKLLGVILPMVTPAIKEELGELVKQLHEKALKTDNPIDDYLTSFLMALLGID